VLHKSFVNLMKLNFFFHRAFFECNRILIEFNANFKSIFTILIIILHLYYMIEIQTILIKIIFA
jgi:hypothetical protein